MHVWARRAVFSAVVALAAGMFAPAGASATVGLRVAPQFDDAVLQVGQIDRGGTISVTNLNSAVEGTAWICRHDDDPTGLFPMCAGAEGLVLTPSCGAQYPNALCRPGPPGPPPSGADPDVFAIHSSATGQSGRCAGVPFTTTRVPGSLGKVRFDPPPGVQIVLVKPGDECTIRFSFDVLRTPAIDRRPDLAGLQTSQVAEATEQSRTGGVGSGQGSPSPVTVLLASPTARDAALAVHALRGREAAA